MANKTSPKPPVVNVNDERLVGTQYAQVVTVTVSDIDITLEFIYVNPRVKTKGNVISRITLPKKSGEELATTIRKTVMAHASKKKGKK
jgi:hypothetical protein